jgi:hypothetical protein
MMMMMMMMMMIIIIIIIIIIQLPKYFATTSDRFWSPPSVLSSGYRGLLPQE